MKLQLEAYGRKYTIETQYDDVPIEEYLDFFRNLLVQATFSQSTVDDAIIEFAQELDSANIKIDRDGENCQHYGFGL